MSDSKKIETVIEVRDVSPSEYSVDERKWYQKVFQGKQVENDVKNHDENEPYIDLDVEETPEREARRKTLKYRLLKVVWDGIDKHPDEQRFLLKLDWFLLSHAMLGNLIKNLNQSNMSTAYVNGMEEYYNMTENQYQYMTTLWTVGYIIGAIPSNLILHRISARYYLGGLEIIWSFFTLLLITPAKGNIQGIYGLRFILGLVEAGYFPGMEYLLGSWYTPQEITKRSAYFAASSAAASLISGPLQQGIVKRFANSNMEPFKWMFVFDCIISFPVGIYTMFVNPNTPSTTDAWYFSKKDKLIALERRRRIGAQLNTRQKYDLKKIKDYVSTWHIWVFPFLFLMYNNSSNAIGYPTFTTWMKEDMHLGSYYYNNYPSIAFALSVVLTVLIAYINDFYGGLNNHWVILSYFIMMTFASACLLAWEIPVGLKWLCYFLLGILDEYAQPHIYSWLNRMLFHNDMKRNFVVVCTNTFSYVINAWVPIFVWDTEDAPRYKIGFIYNTAVSAIGILLTGLVWYLAKRDRLRAKANNETHWKNI